jgi:hypothetical protein
MYTTQLDRKAVANLEEWKRLEYIIKRCQNRTVSSEFKGWRGEEKVMMIE